MVVVCRGLEERLIDGLVGVLQLDILTYKPDGYGFGGIVHAFKKIEPRRHMRLALRLDSGLAQHYLIQVLMVHSHRHLVY